MRRCHDRKRSTLAALRRRTRRRRGNHVRIEPRAAPSAVKLHQHILAVLGFVRLIVAVRALRSGKRKFEREGTADGTAAQRSVGRQRELRPAVPGSKRTVGSNGRRTCAVAGPFPNTLRRFRDDKIPPPPPPDAIESVAEIAFATLAPSNGYGKSSNPKPRSPPLPPLPAAMCGNFPPIDPAEI